MSFNIHDRVRLRADVPGDPIPGPAGTVTAVVHASPDVPMVVTSYGVIFDNDPEQTTVWLSPHQIEAE